MTIPGGASTSSSMKAKKKAFGTVG